MNNGQKSLSINETFIIEAENDGTMSACTGFFTNALVSCTGNTQILLGTDIIQANSVFSATTFYGDGSNLTGIIDTIFTGGTVSGATEFLNGVSTNNLIVYDDYGFLNVNGSFIEIFDNFGNYLMLSNGGLSLNTLTNYSNFNSSYISFNTDNSSSILNENNLTFNSLTSPLNTSYSLNNITNNDIIYQLPTGSTSQIATKLDILNSVTGLTGNTLQTITNNGNVTTNQLIVNVVGVGQSRVNASGFLTSNGLQTTTITPNSVAIQNSLSGISTTTLVDGYLVNSTSTSTKYGLNNITNNNIIYQLPTGSTSQIATKLDILNSVSGNTLQTITNNGNVTTNSIISDGGFITQNGFEGEYLYLKTGTTGTTNIGTTFWDDFYNCPSTVMNEYITLQNGQEILVKVHNNTGSILTDGQVVYIINSTGELPSVGLASASADTTTQRVLGVVTQPIPHGHDGFITNLGVVHNLNTNSLTEGLPIWLGLTPGTYSQTPPPKPFHQTLIGYVIKKAGGNGSIFVNIERGLSLNDNSDVNISGATNNQILKYNGTVWVNSNQKWQGIDDVNSGNGVSGTTIETLDKTYHLPPNTLVNGHLDFSFYSIREGLSSLLHQVVVRVNNVNNFATATELFRISTGGNFSPHLRAQRKFVLKNNLIRDANLGTTPTVIVGVAANGISVPFDLSGDLYIFFSTIPGATNQTIKFDGIQIKQL